MDEVTALHTAVRRFCQEEFARWEGRYASLRMAGKAEVLRTGSHGWDYSDDAYEIFPRYRLVEAIQDEVEKIVPVQAGTLDNMRTLLLSAAQIPQQKLTRELNHPMARQSVTKEASDYQSISGGHWFPLKGGNPPANVIPFHNEFFEKMGGREILRAVLPSHGLRRVFSTP